MRKWIALLDPSPILARSHWTGTSRTRASYTYHAFHSDDNGLSSSDFPFTLVSAFKACTACRELQLGSKLYGDALESGAHADMFVASAAVDMFAKCGSMADARNIFDSAENPDVALCNALILGYVRNGENQLALELFEFMKATPGCKPNERTYVGVFMACGSLAGVEDGKDVDGKLVKLKSLAKGMEAHATCRCAWEAEIFLGNTLVDMYAKSGSLADSRRVFDRMNSHDVVSWNVLLLGYAENGESELAVELFSCMDVRGGLLPNARTYVAALMSCANCAEKQEDRKVRWLERGMAIHAQAAKSNNADIFVGNTLLEMYSKCRSMLGARTLFDRMEYHDVVSWTNLIRGYIDNGETDLALELFRSMKTQTRLELDAGAYVAALTACSTLSEVREVHARAASEAFYDSDKQMIVHSSLVDLYSRFGSMAEAKGVFDSIRSPSLALWNALLMAYEENGYSELALELYTCMVTSEAREMNSRTFVAALMACGSLTVDKSLNSTEFLKIGMDIHSEALRRGYQQDMYVGSALINMYAKCGSLQRAQDVFNSFIGGSKDVVLWTALIAGYSENGENEMALEAYKRMQDGEGSCSPNARTSVTALHACWSLDKVMEIHSQVANSGYDTTETIVANRLIDAYTRFGSMVDARRIFDRMKGHEIVSWTALLQGYAANGEGALALELFSCMLNQAECVPDREAFVAALIACGSASDVETGLELHFEIARRGLEKEPAVATSLVDFYGKAARMVNAQHVFDSMPSIPRNNVPWNALMTGYSHKGDSDQVFKLFTEMLEAGVRVDKITYVSILAACSHAGLVDKGKKLFEAMQRIHGVTPSVEHYTCLADLLGRANHLQEAVTLVESMPVRADVLVWTAVLGACWKWRNAEIGKVAFEGVVSVDPKQVAAYVLMSNIYESVGMWEERDALRTVYEKMVNSPCECRS